MNLKLIPQEIPIFGDIAYRGNCPQETDDHIACISLLLYKFPAFHKILIHPKNEGKRTWGQIAKEKKMGLSSGASDFIIPGSPAFACELKRKDHTKSTISADQISYLVAAQDLGAFSCIALGFDGFRLAIEEYITTFLTK